MDGKYYFDSGVVGWKATLSKLLGRDSALLAGAYLVTCSADTRLCLACPTREARGRLLAALRGLKAV